MENWETINGFKDYMVSDLGRVKMTANKASRKERVLKPLIQGSGYYRVALYSNKKPYFKSIHRLVASHFIKNPNDKEQVNHLDGNKINNAASNLEWCTYRENLDHAVKNRLSSCGERNGRAKLSYTDVDNIRSSKSTSKDLASHYGVHKSTIDRIKNNKGWIK